MALYHSVTGPVSYTVVGTPTIVDGVASGFSSSNYLKSSSTLPANAWQDLEIGTKFTTSDDVSGSQYAVRTQFHTSSIGGIGLVGSSKIGWYIGRKSPYSSSADNVVITSDTTVVANTTYWVKGVIKNNTAELYYSLDGKSYSKIAERDITGRDFDSDSNIISIGSSGGSSGIFTGSIDLNHTYIKVNGAAWFGVCPVEVKHIDYGTSVGYTKVGSPTISSGVASGFSTTSLLQTSSTIKPEYITERVIKVKFNSSAIGSGYNNALYGPNSMSISFYSGPSDTTVSAVTCYLPGDGNSLYKGSLGLAVDTWYWFKYTYDGTTASIYRSNDGITYTLLNSREATISGDSKVVSIGGRWSGTDQYFNGSIDLNQTYIKINGKLWFYRPATNYLVKDNKLVWADSGIYVQEPSTADYTVVGSPTVSSGVMSGFTNNDYAEIRQEPPSGTINSFEFIFSFTTPSDISSAGVLFCRTDANKHSPYVSIGINKLFVGMYDSVAGMYVYVGANGNNLLPNTNYTFKATWVKDDYKVLYLYMKNGDNWVQYDIYIRLFTPVWDDNIFRIGNNRILDMPFSGSIDLNNCSFIVNGDTWWPAGGGAGAKNYATPNMAPVPAGYTYGTTTTTAIGYVDIPTQAFTAAPAGSTLGKDE